MKKKRVATNKQTKTEIITKPKTVIDLAEDLPIFLQLLNVDMDSLNLSITTIVKDLSKPLIQEIRETRDFLNIWIQN